MAIHPRRASQDSSVTRIRFRSRCRQSFAMVVSRSRLDRQQQRRVVAGATAAAIGRGGKTAVAEASGLGRDTVTKGEREVAAGIEPSEPLRARGAGDKPAVD